MQAILYMRENKQTNTSEGYYCELGTYKHLSSLTTNGRFQLIIKLLAHATTVQAYRDFFSVTEHRRGAMVKLQYTQYLQY